MKCGHLFNGIGGFGLAAHWMRWENFFHCEIDPFCNKVFEYYFPQSIRHEDIKQTDFTIYRGEIDVLTGGFPCQPFSVAGKQKGTNDDRHLWPEMLRSIREIKPSIVVAENVPGIIAIEGGVVFEQVCTDLENEGYEVQPVIIPAASVNAPHRRDRIWIVAYRSDTRNMDLRKEEVTADEFEASPNTCSTGLQRCENEGSTIKSRKKSEQLTTRLLRPAWEDFPTKPPICGGNDGLPPRLHGITLPRWRRESIKSYGNAIVPQVAYEILKIHI